MSSMIKLNSVAVPDTLTSQQIKVAKKFVDLRHNEGLSIALVCKHLSISTKTLYGYMDIDVFKEYVKDLEEIIVTVSEAEAYKIIKGRVLKLATKENPSDKHLEMFFKLFGYVVDSENRKRAEELGLNLDGTTTTGKTLQERKEHLLKRLRS